MRNLRVPSESCELELQFDIDHLYVEWLEALTPKEPSITHVRLGHWMVDQALKFRPCRPSSM